MPSERIQRQIDLLLDQAEAALASSDWRAALQAAEAARGFDPDNEDAAAFVAAAERALGAVSSLPQGERTPTTIDPSTASAHGDAELPPLPNAGEGRGEGDRNVATPTSFADGRYNVSKFLGEGGKKRVYLAHDTLLDREVAFALIKTEGFDEVSRSRITREAQAMGRLGTHPNIVTVFDLGTEDSSPYMVTELMGGGDVEGLLEESVSPLPVGEGEGEGPSQADGPSRTSGHGALPLQRTIEIAKAVCDGLEFAHGRGVIHRDLKPGNVWLTEDGTAKIGDFGLAMMTDRSRLTREAMMVGTVSYMPPEQATGGDITAQADLYSLGAMLYEMVTGRPPFLGDDEIAIISQHINTPPVAPTWHNSTCPRPLEALINRLLSKDPSERPESAQDVYNALDAIDLTARGETVERETNSLDSLAGGVFVGRQAEMDQLKGALEDVLGGRGRLVTLVGEPGIGKTRTSEEVATYAGLRGAQVLSGRCYEGGGAPPYWPWVQAIRSYVREIDPDELRRQMGSSASVVSEIVTDVVDRLPETRPPAPMDDPESARFRLFDSITSFLKSASQSQPIVIVLDDLHWSDRPTLTFLEFIARELSQSRVLLLCTYRDMELNRRHPLSITLGDLARERLYERVLLRGLTETDIARFVEVTAGFNAPQELAATIHRHTEGNPLFVTEVVRDLVQSGELTEEKVSGRSSWSVRIPEGVREVIGRRLDRLSDRANDIFTTAAVVGREFTLDALKELSEDTSEGQLLDVLDEALDAKLIEELPEQVGLYQFTHALVQETLLGELSLTRRVRLHARIAEMLERLYGDNADEHAAELARHFGEAEAVLGTDRLVHYLMIAGSELLEVYGHAEALGHYERAIAAVDQTVRDHRLAEISLGLGRSRAHALERAGLQQSVDALVTAFDIFMELGDEPGAIKTALADMPNAHGLVGMAELVKGAIDLISEDTSEKAYLLSQYFQWASFERSEYATDARDRALDIATKNQDERLSLKIIASCMSTAGQHLDHESGRSLVERGREILTRVDDPMSEAAILESASHLTRIDGDLEESLRLTEACLAASERTRSRFRIAIAHSVQGSRLWELGFSDEAVASLDRGMELAPNEPRLLLPRVIIAFALADTDRGLELLKSMSGVEMGDGDVRLARSADVVLALFVERLSQIKPLENMQFDTILRRTMDQTIEPSGRAGASASIGMARVLGYDVGDTQEIFDQLKSRELGYIESIYGHTLILAGLATQLGNMDEAESLFNETVTRCRLNGFKPRLAETCVEYADMLIDRDAPGDKEKAIALQDEALVITRDMGMTPLTERILKRREILKA